MATKSKIQKRTTTSFSESNIIQLFASLIDSHKGFSIPGNTPIEKVPEPILDLCSGELVKTLLNDRDCCLIIPGKDNHLGAVFNLNGKYVLNIDGIFYDPSKGPAASKAEVTLETYHLLAGLLAKEILITIYEGENWTLRQVYSFPDQMCLQIEASVSKDVPIDTLSLRSFFNGSAFRNMDVESFFFEPLDISSADFKFDILASLLNFMMDMVSDGVDDDDDDFDDIDPKEADGKDAEVWAQLRNAFPELFEEDQFDSILPASHSAGSSVLDRIVSNPKTVQERDKAARKKAAQKPAPTKSKKAPAKSRSSAKKDAQASETKAGDPDLPEENGNTSGILH